MPAPQPHRGRIGGVSAARQRSGLALPSSHLRLTPRSRGAQHLAELRSPSKWTPLSPVRKVTVVKRVSECVACLDASLYSVFVPPLPLSLLFSSFLTFALLFFPHLPTLASPSLLFRPLLSPHTRITKCSSHLLLSCRLTPLTFSPPFCARKCQTAQPCITTGVKQAGQSTASTPPPSFALLLASLHPFPLHRLLLPSPLQGGTWKERSWKRGATAPFRLRHSQPPTSPLPSLAAMQRERGKWERAYPSLTYPK
mmetsp:Transcript_26375/g.67277  ORF Transcript_26375/g.67277 Transcript_26375/m.67277 type:complete len:254 (+) Transcript_26375:336-1097(+)